MRHLMPRWSHAPLAIAVFVCLAAGPVAFAQDTFDNDGGDFLWSNPLNWNNDTLPGANSVNQNNFSTFVDDDFSSVTGIGGWRTGVTLTVQTGGVLDLGSGDISGGGDWAVAVTGGSFTLDRIFTNGSIKDRVGNLSVSAGLLRPTGRIYLNNTNFETTATSSVTVSGGVLDNPSGRFRLYGADADDRASLNIIGSTGTFSNGNGTLTLFNTSEGHENSATDVNFILDLSGVTTITTSSVTLGGNALTIDFSGATTVPGVYMYDLIDYGNSVTGAFAAPTFVGLGAYQSASFVHDTVEKKFSVEYTVVPEPSCLLLLTATASVAWLRRRSA